MTEDLKLEKLKNILAKLFVKNMLEVEQITLDFLERADYKLENITPHSIFDLELTLDEIKGEARKIIKSQSMWQTDTDLKVLNKVLEINYNTL